MGRNYADFKGDKNPNYKTGYAPVSNRPSFYNSWCNMKQRCLNKKHPKYHRYGGRGITIVDEWLSIEGFSKWALSSGWKEGLSIDRIDNDGDYSPENCIWATMASNSRKKSTTKISFEQARQIRERIDCGENMQDLADEYNVVNGTIWFIANNITHVSEGECSKALLEMKNRKKE